MRIIKTEEVLPAGMTWVPGSAIVALTMAGPSIEESKFTITLTGSGGKTWA